MKIALVAPADEKVPPAKYGGTELVVANLANGLKKQGHDVHLFAAGDSQTDATLHATFPHAFREEINATPYPEALRGFYNSIALGRAVGEIAQGNFDIVHNHASWRLLTLAHLLNAPVISTMHGPYDVPFIPEFAQQYPDSSFISISESQGRINEGMPFIGTVYNGIDVEKFSYSLEPGEYLAFLGRTSPEKGLKEAILAAKAANTRLVIAAKVDAVDRDYFEKEVKPLIDGGLVQFIGEVDLAGKVELLRHAKALLMLIQWDEPFGLVMTEAMACGTPVIAIARGSTPELIQEGITGFLIRDNLEEAVTAIHTIEKLNRQACRDSVVERFSSEAMVEGYLSFYRTVIAAHQSAH